MTKNERAAKVNEIIAKNPSDLSQKAEVINGRLIYWQLKHGRLQPATFMEMAAAWNITDEVRALVAAWRAR